MIRQTSPLPGPPFSEPEQPDVEDDLLAKAGAQLPSHLKTRSQRWGVLFLVAGTGAFASGPSMSWPTLEPLLISEGVWAGPDQDYKLSTVYSLAAGVTMVSFFIAGVLYDVLGPRALGVGGALGVVVCLWLMAIAVKIPQLNNLLWVAYPAATCFGSVNSLAAYAWMWLLPENQSFVSSTVGVIQALSDSFCLIAVFLSSTYGVKVSTYFGLCGALSILTAILAWILVPAPEDVRRVSDAVIQYMAGATPDVEVSGKMKDYGAVSNDVVDTDLVDSKKPSDLLDGFSKAWLAMKDTYVVATKLSPTIFFLFFTFCVFMYMFCMYQMVEMYPFYTVMVGTAKATRLVDIFGAIYSFFGAVLVMVYGKVMDWIGLSRLMCISSLLCIVNAYLYSIPSVSAQVGAQMILTGSANIWYVFGPTFANAYGPPELFGTIVGVNWMLLGIGQVCLTQFGTWAGDHAAALFSHFRINQAALPYLLITDLWCGLSVLFTTFMMVWWWYNPVPKPGAVTMAQVRKAARDPDTMSESLLLDRGMATLPQRSPQTGPST